MNREPEYIYVKGQGWVLKPSGFYVFDKYGQQVFAEQRMPRLNEHYLRADDVNELMYRISLRPWNAFYKRGGSEDATYAGDHIYTLTPVK